MEAWNWNSGMKTPHSYIESVLKVKQKHLHNTRYYTIKIWFIESSSSRRAEFSLLDLLMNLSHLKRYFLMNKTHLFREAAKKRFSLNGREIKKKNLFWNFLKNYIAIWKKNVFRKLIEIWKYHFKVCWSWLL